MEKQVVVQDKGMAMVRLRVIPQNAMLVDARGGKGFTTKHLSILTGVPISTIEGIENLRFVPRLEVMEELSSALEKPVDFLFPPVLMEAVAEGVFHERKAFLKPQQIAKLTEAKRLKPQLALNSGGVDEVERRIDEDLGKNRLRELLPVLSEREQIVLTLRLGLDGNGERSQEEVAQVLGVCKERIRQNEARAVVRLRHPSRRKKLKLVA